MKTLITFLACLAATHLALAAAYPATEKFSQSYPISDGGELFIEAINGSIEIIAWDKNEISLDATKRARNTDELQRIIIHIDATPDRLAIKTEHLKTGWFRSRAKGDVLYTLRVPTGITLKKAGAVNASVTIRGVRGPVAARTVNGSIRADGLVTESSLESVNGSVSARVVKLAAGQALRAKTVNGSCVLTLPANIVAEVRAETVNGTVSSVLPITIGESRRNKIQGRIGEGPSASIEAKTVNGNVTLECD